MLAPKKVALALSETSGILYIACAVFVAIAPQFSLKLLGWLAHLTAVDQFISGFTFGGVVLGLAQVLVYAYISGWLFAVLYNRATK